MNAWLSQHRAALALAFRRLLASPLNTLLSLLVIGIALTLPAFGYVALDNLRDLRGLVDRGVEGAIIGTGLYVGRFTIEEALAVAEGGG